MKIAHTIAHTLSKGLVEENEDTFRITEKFLALADGAGGVGVFAKEWATYLLEHLPDEPFNENSFDEWHKITKEEFKKQQNLFLQQSPEKEFVKNKFQQEGSASTLAVAWLQTRENITTLTYGDSAILHYQSLDDTLSTSLTISNFIEAPCLVGTQKPIDAKCLSVRTLSLAPNDLLLIASDALAAYLIAAYTLSHRQHTEFAQHFRKVLDTPTLLGQIAENLQNFGIGNYDFRNEILPPLLTDNFQAFAEHIKLLQDKKLMMKDDVTLIAYSCV